MSAETADNAGTPQLKQFLMVNIKTKFPRGIELSEALPCVREAALSSSLDQVISGKNSTECKTRAPDPGLKQQASSLKPQASSSKILEPRYI